MSNSKIYVAERIFTGAEMLQDHAIVVEDDVIIAIVPSTNINNDFEITAFKNLLIAPAFIDLQLYGAHKRLLSTYPDGRNRKSYL